MHFKRKKCKRVVRCAMCTDVRWRGNKKGRFKRKDEAAKREFKRYVA